MSILLTIVIPTYNRLNYLKYLIPEISQQIEKINNEKKLIELLVCDNNSSDGTEEYILHLKKKYNIRYYKNIRNYGAEKNFILGIKRAKGIFIWIFGDDDLICNEGISRVIGNIIKFNSALLIVREKNYNIDLDNSMSFKTIRGYIKYFSRLKPNFLLDHTLISSNIFKKNIFDFNAARNKYSSEYSLMYGIISGLLADNKEDKSIYFLNKPIIEVRQQRAKFATEPKNLIKKQKDYLIYLSKISNDFNLKKYTIQWYIHRYIKSYLINKFPLISKYKNFFIINKK